MQINRGIWFYLSGVFCFFAVAIIKIHEFRNGTTMEYKLVAESFGPKFVIMHEGWETAEIVYKSVFRNLSDYPMILKIEDDVTFLQDKSNSESQKASREHFIAPKSAIEFLWPHISNLDPNA